MTIRLPNGFSEGAKMAHERLPERRIGVIVTTFHFLIVNAAAHEPPTNVCFRGYISLIHDDKNEGFVGGMA
jgi:hypothetical protein